MNRLSPLPVLTLLFASLLLACQPSALSERDRRNEVDDVVDVDDGGTDLEGCGDGAAADGEVCDSGDVRGGTCAEFGFTRGTLGCQADCARFDFSGCEEPLSACAGHVCQNGGSCVVVAGAPACACPDGFEGAVCERATAPSACETIICSNGGLCGLPGLEDAAEPSCDCTPFFSGETCDDPIANPRGDGGHEIEFYFRWQADDATPPVEHLPEAVSPPEVDVGGDTVILPSGSAAQRLLNEHRIVLDDEELAWDDSTATALLRTLQRFPTPPVAPEGSFYRVLRSASAINQDVEVGPEPADEPWVWSLRFANDAFTLANPIQQPPHDGVERVFYSNRLYRAVLRSFFRDIAALEEVLLDRYGVAVRLGEPKEDFQRFTYEELVFILSVFEDYPSGFRNLPNLQYLTRRKNGLVNPWHPTAPAIAWVDSHEVEFMDFAFTSASADYIHRLVAHELSHFVYDLFDPAVLATWQSLSEWVEVEEDNWVAGTNTNFVSDYAHDINPNEDFAETLSFYIYDPDWVRTIAPTKYEFIRGIVDGYEYVVIIDERVVFQVFNLYPDTTFPGRIVRVTNTVTKFPDGSHHAHMELRIHQPPYESTIAYTRMYSPGGDIFRDVYFYPDSADPTRLVANEVFGPLDPDGYWSAPNITIREWGSSNTTHLGQNDFGWLLWFDNDTIDVNPPTTDLSQVTGAMEKIGDEYHITVTAPVSDQQIVDVTGYAELQNYASGQDESEYGTWNADTQIMTWRFVIRPYRANGTWTFRTFRLIDVSGNEVSLDLQPNVLEFVCQTARPDYTPPVLDQEFLSAEAHPTNPDAPNGETDVFIRYRARDNNAGLGPVSFRLLRPSGSTMFDYHTHENFWTDYFEGDPTVFTDYTIHVLLPVGSEPGTWGVQEITLCDKAGNCQANQLTELGIIAPVE